MHSIDSFFQELDRTLKSHKFKNCSYPVFRGHSKMSYELLPTLQRSFLTSSYKKNKKSIWDLENNLYCDFRSLVGPRVLFRSSWDTLFAMRHEGVPTRLLDWTENVGTALFFALSSKDVERPHIWILNPYHLNNSDSIANGTLLNPEEDLRQYSETYANYCNVPIKSLHSKPIAVYPNRSNGRIFAQRGIFTIHGKNNKKMEDQCPDTIEKIEIRKELIHPLKNLLKYFGINNYSVYPDFKGLCDHLKEFYGY